MTSSVADSLVGRLIDGRYRILSHLADGGMASVYVAMDARLHREVALKIMRPALAQDAVFVDRFRSEARSAARLGHPNVVAVYDQGEDRGDVFLVMELVQGKTLRQVIHEEAPLTPREALAILEPILEALRAAHAGGIVHRDVKPENVIIRADGEVKVADFGLARAITTQGATSASGVLLGTVSYTAPEQVERGVVGPRSDVYAAGLVLFEMLTGRKAVTGETPIQVAYRHVHGSIEPPSAVVPGLPDALDELVACATATDADDRYASATEFLANVRSVRSRLSAHELDRQGDAVTESYAAAAPERTRAIDTAPPPRTDRTDHPGHSRTEALPLVQTRTKEPPRRRGRGLWVTLLIVALVLGGGGAWWFTAGPGSVTTVPTYARLSLDEAAATLAASSLRTSSSEAFSETVPKGQVISGQPESGAEVPKQSVVELVISKGPERYAVPKLVGTPGKDASGALAGLNLKLGKTTEGWSETAPAGVVLSQSPQPGVSVKRDTVVTIVVSKGRQPIKVPVVTGRDVAAAEAAITKAGLKVKRVEDVNSDTVPAGSIVSQSPDKGTLLRGDTVTLTVSKGPVMVEVPRVVGFPIAEAKPALEKLGFTVEVRRPLGTFFELVRDQSVAPGQLAPKGSRIILTVV
ncbi:MAG TPA: Stk1 family PASTA domain-containing Ser/Thr kinase [Dermatophilaceae bacterium]|nr:Stk1 family PASTA domain-containing Ser/Thr kinase [Dermatophilaceae bacterium]